jgi:hypothetical protein
MFERRKQFLDRRLRHLKTTKKSKKKKKPVPCLNTIGCETRDKSPSSESFIN